MATRALDFLEIPVVPRFQGLVVRLAVDKHHVHRDTQVAPGAGRRLIAIGVSSPIADQQDPTNPLCQILPWNLRWVLGQFIDLLDLIAEIPQTFLQPKGHGFPRPNRLDRPISDRQRGIRNQFLLGKELRYTESLTGLASPLR